MIQWHKMFWVAAWPVN